jgi:hypothetical protein
VQRKSTRVGSNFFVFQFRQWSSTKSNIYSNSVAFFFQGLTHSWELHGWLKNIWLREFILATSTLLSSTWARVFGGLYMLKDTSSPTSSRKSIDICVSESSGNIWHMKNIWICCDFKSKRKMIGVEYCVDGWETIVFEKNRLRRVISKNVIRKI